MDATGDIGLFKIVQETSLAAGVRRIEAVTGMNALEWVFSREDVLVDLASELKSSVSEVPTRVRKLSDDLGHLRDELDSIRAQTRSAGIASAEPETVGGISALIVRQTVSKAAT